MKHRGHPIRGAIAGLFLGLFVSLDLVIFGVVALDADILALLPLLGLAAGLALGLTAPLHRHGPADNARQESTAPHAIETEPVEPQAAEATPTMAVPEP